jgi:hypothetical protein
MHDMSQIGSNDIDALLSGMGERSGSHGRPNTRWQQPQRLAH